MLTTLLHKFGMRKLRRGAWFGNIGLSVLVIQIKMERPIILLQQIDLIQLFLDTISERIFCNFIAKSIQTNWLHVIWVVIFVVWVKKLVGRNILNLKTSTMIDNNLNTKTKQVTYHNATYNFHHKIAFLPLKDQPYINYVYFVNLQPLYKSCTGKRHSKYKTVVTI